MEFRILGPLQVFDDARPLALGGPKQRAVLAHLILRANHTVGAEQLVDGLWGDEPPETARNTLQTYVYRLRKVLGEERLEGRDGGYVLTAAPEEVDAARFEAIVRDAKRLSASDPAAAATRFGDALALWRGAPLDDLGQEPSLRGEIARLEELHLSATEHRIGAEIASGRNSTVVSELEALTARYPLRERMWANLMLALYRGGRQAEALSTYQRARDVLIEELGTEPSTELQRLHERILQRDASLGSTEPPRQVVRSSRVDLPSGTEFAGYRIERTLGRGGMSVVYLAEHDWLQRKVALKVLAPQLAEDDRFRERFVRESRLAASLDHPNVIPIYEAGASAGDLFIAMRYVEGTDLRTLLHEEGTLDPSRTIAIVRRIAAALDAAHEQGLVHRDVKPGNVLLARPRGADTDEHVYLSDFGLTKRSVSDSGITGTGQFVGTLDYAAPEQFRGGAPDARTDVYSLGCVLFECLVGHPPFSSDSDAGLMYAHLQERPPYVTQERPGLPKEIDRVVARAMAKEPTDRQQSAGSLVDEASRALGLDADAGGDARSQRQTRPRAIVGLAAVVVALVTGVVASTLFRGETAPAAGIQPTGDVASPSPTIAPAFQTIARPRALSDDEERLLASIPEDVTVDCRPLDRDEPIQGELAALVCRTPEVEVLYELFPTRDLMDAAFQTNVNNKSAPDGQCATDHLAVTTYAIAGKRAGRVLCYTVEAGLARVQGQEPPRSHIEWTDENTSIYAHAVRNDLSDLSLYTWWASSSGPLVPGEDDTIQPKDVPSAIAGAPADGTYLTAPPGGCAGFKSLTCRLHLHDSEYEIAFTGEPGTAETGTVLLQKPNAVVFTPETGYCLSGELGGGRDPRPTAYAWSADHDQVTFERLRGGRCAGPQKHTDGAWSRAPAGKVALSTEGEITLIDPGGYEIEPLTSDLPTTPNKDPDWSPDGTKIVFAGGGEDNDDLYVMNPDGSGVTRLTDDEGNEYDPAWSPDGTRIAFGHDDLGQIGEPYPFHSSIAVVTVEGNGWTTLIRREDEALGWPAWAPDGGRIAFSAWSRAGASLYVMNVDGTGLREIHHEPEASSPMPVFWAPDGKQLVFWGSQGGGETLLSIRPDGTGVRKLVDDLPAEARVLTVDWSPDGRWIVAAPIHDLTAVSGQASNVYLIRPDGSDVFAISGSGYEPSWRPETG